MKLYRLLFTVLFLSFFSEYALARAPKVLKLQDLKSGTRAIGFSVFSGVEPEPFDVVLGESINYGGLNLILARLSGGPMETLLEKIGPVAGMSGSPIFIGCGDNQVTAEEKLTDCIENGTLVGALSYGVGSFTEGGINFMLTPAEKMLGTNFHGYGFANQFSYPATISYDGKDFHNLMLFPGINNMAVGDNSSPKCPEPTKSNLKPGSMISVYLADGPIPVGGSGTVTWVDNDKIYAFGHPLFGTGMVSYPFVHVGVAATIQSPLDAHKIAGCRLDTSGVILVDGAYEIAGAIGGTASLLPLEIVAHFGNIEFSLKENIAFGPLARMIITELPFIWAEGQLGDIDRLSLAYQARVVVKDKPEFFLKNVIPVSIQARENPFRQVFGNIAKIFEGLEKTGTRSNVESVKVHIDFVNNLKVWTNKTSFLSQTSAKPGETVYVNIVLEEMSTAAVKQMSIPIKIPEDFMERVNPTEGYFANIGVVVQGASKFKDKREDTLKSENYAEKILEELRDAINRSANILYIQQTMPKTKTDRDSNSSKAKSATKPTRQWSDLEAGDFSEFPKGNYEVTLTTSSALDHYIDFEASFKIEVEPKEKTSKPAPKQSKNKSRKWFFLFLH